jgi:hypothetical protein
VVAPTQVVAADPGVVAAEFGWLRTRGWWLRSLGGCGLGAVAGSEGWPLRRAWWLGAARRWDFSHCGIGGYFRQCGMASNVSCWRE